MLIVLSQDVAVRSWATNEDSGSQAWGEIVVAPVGAQQQASAVFAQSVQHLAQGEPLLVYAHGNDEEIGDESPQGWGWDVAGIAQLLAGNAPANWRGPLVIWACAEQVSNFSTRLTLALQQLRVFDGMWLYGFNLPLPVQKSFPPPQNLDKQADLQHAQVTF